MKKAPAQSAGAMSWMADPWMADAPARQNW